MKNIFLQKSKLINDCQPELPSSKSESNRALIIQSLAKEEIILHNISNARDTQTMQRLLQSTETELDVLDAGTTMRFLTAFHAIGKKEIHLTGSARMQERPIGILVEALNKLGAAIEFKNKQGYPPLLIKPFQGQKTKHISVEGHISSQFISALMLIGSSLADGLVISIKNKLISKPYVEMTLSLMHYFGAKAEFTGQEIIITPSSYRSNDYTIESDWSAASYWYAFLCLSSAEKLFLKGLRKNSFQGDAQIARFMEKFGIHTRYEKDGVYLQKRPSEIKSFEADMLNTPDLAQTIAVICAVKSIPCTLSGVQSLIIKETDRVTALKNELAKIGATVDYDGEKMRISPANHIEHKKIQVNTYDDHRMAMAFAPLSMLMGVEIQEKEVVNKSYPDFWKEVEKCVTN